MSYNNDLTLIYSVLCFEDIYYQLKNLSQWKKILIILTTVPLLFFSSCSSGDTCCKTCTTGKACGDSCIAKNLNCNEGAGCACDG